MNYTSWLLLCAALYIVARLLSSVRNKYIQALSITLLIAGCIILLFVYIQAIDKFLKY